MGRAEWIAAARAALIKGGIAAVKVAPLATTLGVTTGSFYWHFKDRPDLLGALLDDWKATNTRPLFEAAAKAGPNPDARFLAVCKVWIAEDDFDPAYDSSVRDWARASSKVDAAVRRVDGDRIELLRGIFLDMGDSEADAFLRARIVYFHQVGYYALHIRETTKKRLKLLPSYVRLLLGRTTGDG